jgi:threonine synthase
MHYDLAKGSVAFKKDVRNRPFGDIYRYSSLLPLGKAAEVISMREGGTPLLPLHSLGKLIGVHLLCGKDETRNPTHSFKDRAMSVAVSIMKQIKASDAGCISGGGNTGTSAAAYCARAGIKAHLYMPSSTPKAKILHALALGATVNIIEGTSSQNAFVFGVRDIRKRKYLPLMTRPQLNPFTLEGCKTIAFELAEQTGWSSPDWVVLGVGTGTNLAGVWKGFKELYRANIIKNLPHLAAVQAETCMPLVDAFNRGIPAEEIVNWPNAYTIASGLNDAYPDACIGALRALRESKGAAVSVSDQEILSAELLLARQEGIFAEPAGAASVAGCIRLTQEEILDPNDKVTCLITGSGVKQTEALAGYIDIPPPLKCN